MTAISQGCRRPHSPLLRLETGSGCRRIVRLVLPRGSSKGPFGSILGPSGIHHGFPLDPPSKNEDQTWTLRGFKENPALLTVRPGYLQGLATFPSSEESVSPFSQEFAIPPLKSRAKAELWTQCKNEPFFNFFAPQLKGGALADFWITPKFCL